jgi:phosphoribosylamine--glycine ligase / phosphoribosylformylglycinamidine cyclo-ligase
MNIIVIGSGGREYAIIKSLLKSNQKIDIYGMGEYSNPGILRMVKGFKVMEEFNTIDFLSFVKNINPRFVVIGPEKYLNLKLPEILYNENIPCIGPMGIMAKIETSKIFCRQFLNEHSFGNFSPEYWEINSKFNERDLFDIFEKINNRFVIKPNGLTGGKGVKLYDNNNAEAYKYIKELLNHNSYLLLEERLEGDEFVLLSFCDGKTIKHMPIIKDFKRVREGSDLNTGSMGCIIQDDHKLNFLDNSDIIESHFLNGQVMDKLSYIHEYGYRGILYGNYMKTPNGIKLIEFNARFGDPEVIPVLDLLETDLFDIFDAITLQKLDEIEIIFKKQYSLCKYLVPNGYPLKPIKGREISITNLSTEEKNKIYLAGVKSVSTNLVLTGSRTIAVCKSGNNIQELYDSVESIISKIEGPLFHRQDIKNENIEITTTNTTTNTNTTTTTNNLYQRAGVNIEEGNKVVDKIRNSLESTYDDNVITQWGDFGGLYNMGKFLRNNIYKEPIMVSSTDGVGTKTCFILENMDPKEGMRVLGQDIVNHCVNDILVKGASPMMFLDYFASSKIDSDLVASFVEGVSKACKENSCSLMGGETAEMPGVYNNGKCDIVGTILGVVDKIDMIMGKEMVEAGYLVYAIGSSGPHTNGYSLIRKIYEENPDLDVHKNLLNPHRSYLSDINILKSLGVIISGLCHITGGGFYENIPRVLADDLAVELNLEIKSPFRELGEIGKISNRELLTVFNCGYGMLVFIDPIYQSVINLKLIGRVIMRENGESVRINITN